MAVEDLIRQFNLRAKARAWLQFCDPDNGFVLDECAALSDLWHNTRNGGPLPRRSDLTPQLLKPYLSRLALVEMVEREPPAFRFRLVGTTVTNSLSERTGQGFDHESATAEQTERWTNSTLLSLQVLKPLRFPIVIAGRMVGETVLLPLADDDDQPRFVLAYGRYEPQRNWNAAYPASVVAAAAT
ncbi:MAG TPA: PAS domain-containing protein [Rhizomicrobium sp.]|jgi:hypothetical protein